MLNVISRQRGVSLVELMVGIVVGLFVVLVAGTVYLNTFYSSADSTRLIRLNQDLRAIMDVLTFDLHRAGFSGKAAAGISDNPFAYRSGTVPAGKLPTDIHISPDQTCILYSFDLDLDGAVGSNEYFGFRYNSAAKQVEVLNQSGASPVSDTSQVADCAAYSWQPLNLPSEVEVTAMTFSTEGSRCLTFDPTLFSPGSPTTFVQWQLTGNNTVAACDMTGAAGSMTPLAGAGHFSPAGATVTSAMTAWSEVREVVVTITARHARDTTLTRTQIETIRVHNDRVSSS